MHEFFPGGKLPEIDEQRQFTESLGKLLEMSRDMFFLCDGTGRIIHMNKALRDYLGISNHQVLGLTIEEFCASGHTALAPDQSVSKGHMGSLATEIIGRHGLIHSVTLISCNVSHQGKNVMLVIVSHAQDAKKHRPPKPIEMFRAIAETCTEAIIALDSNRRVRLWNPAAEEIFGFSREEVLGEPCPIVLDTEIHPASPSVKHDNPKQKTVSLRNANGLRLDLLLTASPILDSDGDVTGMLYLARPQDEQQFNLQKVGFLANKDRLTRLYNRNYFEDKLREFDEPRYLPLSVIFASVNGLQLVNDVFGYEAGDELLKKVAQVLRQSTRKSDVAARWGGSKFAILLPKTSYEMALAISADIERCCANAYSPKAQVSIALGVATKTEEKGTTKAVIREARDRVFRQKLTKCKRFRHNFLASIERILQETTFETKEHSRRVRKVALELGRALHLPGATLDELSLLADLHDIGKVAVPQSILYKPASLSKEEWKEIEQHPAIGYRVTKTIPELAHVAEAILAHHENWDGTGYPQGLIGEEIPLISRIISIADTFDAVTHDRPYREAVSEEQALEIIRDGSGTQFDPHLVKVFLSLYNQAQKE